VDYRHDDFAAAVHDLTGGRGVDVVLDCIGGPYLSRNLEVLRTGGTVVVIGLMGGRSSDIDLATVLRRHLRVVGSTLRSRSDGFKRDLVRAFVKRFGDALAGGELQPVVDRVVPLGEAESAHEALEAGEVFGKIVLSVTGT
jgi:NADPH:quinone reductase-like Zn-dependent oxidoreductase